MYATASFHNVVNPPSDDLLQYDNLLSKFQTNHSDLTHRVYNSSISDSVVQPSNHSI